MSTRLCFNVQENKETMFFGEFWRGLIIHHVPLNRLGLKSRGYNEDAHHCQGRFESVLLRVALGRVGMRMLPITILKRDEFK